MRASGAKNAAGLLLFHQPTPGAVLGIIQARPVHDDAGGVRFADVALVNQLMDPARRAESAIGG